MMTLLNKNLILTCLLSLAISAVAQQSQSKKTLPTAQPVQIQLKTAADSAQYILGAYLGQYVVGNGFSITNADLFVKGMNDAISNIPLLVPAETVSKKIAEYQNRMTIERSILLEKQLFESLKTQTGLGMLPSGVYYSVLKAGSGRRPLATDSVVLQVKGQLPDGKLVEDTYQKNAPYRLTPSSLIPGMGETVQIMPAGSIWRIYIPSALAFGEKGLPGVIPPHSAVVFDIELVQVK